MAENIHQRLAGLPPAEQREVTKLFDAVLTDMAALRTQLLAAHVDIDVLRAAAATLATKLNADAGVTDTDYAAPAAATIADPPALTLES